MGFIKKTWVWIAAIFIIGLFLWLRFYNIDKSFFFWNDMGRDMMALQDWQTSKRPPLLGPQTSALPINQSPVYFYLLMPGFLLTNGAPISMLYTNAFLYIATFLTGLYLFRNNKKYQLAILTFFFLATISPQYVIQNRFVWNPSFITPFLAVAAMSFYLTCEKFSKLRLLIFTASMALSVSISYSVAPVMIAAFLIIFFTWKKNKILAVLYEFIALLVINFPTLLFEVRHHFVLTASLLANGSSLQGTQDISFLTKFNNLFGFGLSVSRSLTNPLLAILFLVIAWNYFKGGSKEMKLFSKLLLLTLVITLLAPLAIHSHYVFGFTTLLFFVIAFLPKTPRFLLLGAFCVLYLSPDRFHSYFLPARRTVEEMNRCFKQVCGEISKPMYVSVQAGFHPFHSGPEHLYLMTRAGCNMKDIKTSTDQADLMAVVLDESTFDIKTTGYWELTRFGKAKEVNRYNCQPNFGVVIISKTSN